MPKKKNNKPKPKKISNDKYAESLNNYNALRDAIEHQYINKIEIKPTLPNTYKHFEIA